MAKETKLDKAEVQALPDVLEEVDVLKYEKLQLQLQNLELTKQVLQQQLQGVVEGLNAKYSLKPEDTVDMQSRKITRKA